MLVTGPAVSDGPARASVQVREDSGSTPWESTPRLMAGTVGTGREKGKALQGEGTRGLGPLLRELGSQDSTPK